VRSRRGDTVRQGCLGVVLWGLLLTGGCKHGYPPLREAGGEAVQSDGGAVGGEARAHAPEAAARGVDAGAQSMIETLRRLCALLVTEEITAREVASRMGSDVQDPGSGLALRFRPADPACREAHVARVPGSEEPAHVEFELAAPGTVTVAEVTAAFGAYKSLPRLHPGDSQRIIMRLGAPEDAIRCAVLAAVTPGPSGIADGRVTQVTVRRDRK
jgi:hypothetical protein